MLIVDPLEVIEVHDTERHLLPQSITALPLALEQHFVLAPIEQTGQRVGCSLALKLGLQRFAPLDLILQVPIAAYHLHQQRILTSLGQLPAQRGEKPNSGRQAQNEPKAHHIFDPHTPHSHANHHADAHKGGSQQ